MLPLFQCRKWVHSSISPLPASEPNFHPYLGLFLRAKQYLFLSLFTKRFVFKSERRCLLNFCSQKNNSWYILCLILQEWDSPSAFPAGMREAGGIQVWLLRSQRYAIKKNLAALYLFEVQKWAYGYDWSVCLAKSHNALLEIYGSRCRSNSCEK